MTELHGAVAVAQLDKLDDVVDRRIAHGRRADRGAWQTCRASQRRRSTQATCTPTGSTACASMPASFPAARSTLGSGPQAARHLLRPALHPEAGVRVPGLSRPADVRQQPLAVHARPARGGRLQPRASSPAPTRAWTSILVLPLNETYTSEHVRLHRRIAIRDVRRRTHKGAACMSSTEDAIRPDRRRGDRPDLRPGLRAVDDGASWSAWPTCRIEAAQALAERLQLPGVRHRRGAARRRPSSRRSIVCTPPVTHPEICCWLLERGMHVLCEKPLAIGPDEARAMIAAAERSQAHAHDGVEVPLRRRRGARPSRSSHRA